MCIDFTNLNTTFPKDMYPLPNIDRLIDGSSRNKTLSYIDANSRNNKINKDPMDVSKTTLMFNHGNY